MWHIWRTEWRISMRQRSFYAFFILWVVVNSLLFQLVKNVSSLSSYTNVTGTTVNLVLYMIPLFMLIIGSFTIANEMENGQWKLLCTYPISSFSYVIGKYGGQATAQLILFTMSFGTSMLIGLLFGIPLSLEWTVALFIFSVWLLLLFLLLGVSVGALVHTRWQALVSSVIVWFLLIIMWPSMIIAILSFVPYTWISPILKSILFFNPAELLRVVFIVTLNGGSVFGQTYDTLIVSLSTPFGWTLLLVYTIIFSLLCLLVASWKLERGRWQ
ncbi:ABC transporter permease [Ectobacillus sp. sgz5001026]|uniref:ABC transporter permease n=1 Tax=Ectobacillus sp. sgz5001026 TaxID=3242473 RepID=UPI0036D3FAC7